MQIVAVNAFFAAAIAAGVALPVHVWAQTAGERAETGPPTDPHTSPFAQPRTSLWHDVQAQYRQPHGAAPATERRLSAEQRLQLRQQVREQLHGQARESAHEFLRKPILQTPAAPRTLPGLDPAGTQTSALTPP